MHQDGNIVISLSCFSIKIIITISENDCPISDPQSVAEIINNHFVSKGQIKDSAHQLLNEHSKTAEIISYFKNVL